MIALAIGDARSLPIAAGSVQCVVTSPPYWGLRDYGVPGQLGLESTPDEYVASMVAVFREVWRVLRDDGTVWCNLGDSYAGSPSGFAGGDVGVFGHASSSRGEREMGRRKITGNGLKPKDLVGIPWRVAFALQADGWTLRQDIVWSKPNPMPESVKDRCTKAHEFLFLFSKAKWIGPERSALSYISDADARWLALLLDTEGNICVKRVERNGRKWYGAQIAVGGTSRELMEAARGIVRLGAVLERNGTNAPMFYWQLSNRQAAALLYRIYPFLIVKRRQARIVMHLQSLLRYRGGRGDDRRRTDAEVAALESLWIRNKACNSFEYPDLLDVPEPRYGRWDSQKYYYDAEAIREDAVYGRREWSSVEGNMAGVGLGGERGHATVSGGDPSAGRNRRSVWTVNTQPYPEAHFATFPEKLVEPCVLAGSKPWDLVMDPFAGSGTVGVVCRKLARRFVGVELNPAYVALAAKRLQGQRGLPLEATA